MPKKAASFSSLVLLAFTILVGCSSNNQSGSQTTQAPATEKPSETKVVEEKNDYPSKKISFILPNSPGGGGDIFYRTFAQIAEKYIDQPIIIENKEGGSGALAMNELQKREADGHTIFGVSQSEAYAIAHGVIPSKMEDLLPISTIAAGRDALFTLETFKTYDDFKQFGLDNPGKMKIASVGTYNDNHVSAMSMMEKSGIKGQYIPYDNPGLADKAILAGDAHAAVASVSAVSKLVQAGSHTLLAVGGVERLELFPNVPTFREISLEMDGFDYRGFAVKPGTPKPLIDEFNKLVQQVMKDPEWQKYLKNTGQEDYFKTAEEFQELFNEDYKNGKATFEKFKQ